MALLACGANESYDAYLAALERHVTERYAEQGTLDALMATEYSRTILTVAMLGGDPAAFGTRPDGTTVDLLDDGVWKFSLRTGERVNATEVCRLLGGGGHARAAGATLEHVTQAEAEEKMLDAIARVVPDFKK